MCILVGDSEETIKKCPVRRTVYLSERHHVESLEFVDDSFMHAMGCTGHTPGVVIDGAKLGLIHTVTFLDCRVKRNRGPSMSIHFIKASLNVVDWQYYYCAPPGWTQRRLFRIPSEDILQEVFHATEARPGLCRTMAWEKPSASRFPFGKYEIPIVDSVEVQTTH